jgi:hypothetical protein
MAQRRERVVENASVAGTTGRDNDMDFARLLAQVERSEAVRLAALAAVRDGVITGEGATAAGRIHFSRCIDAVDTATIRRILTAGGVAAVSRAEADAVFDIHDAAIERIDGGAFDDLLAKAVTHHVLAAAGRSVLPRASALAEGADRAVLDPAAVEDDTMAWLKGRLNRKRRPDGPIAALASAIGATVRGSLAGAIDLAA